MRFVLRALLRRIPRGLIGAVLVGISATAGAQAIRVTLLGTGSPGPVMNRFGPSILVEAGEQKFVFDAGRGAMQLIRHAKGVDLLVHEVAAPETFQRAGITPEQAATIVAHHTTPERAGEIFARARPKLAVYSHIVRPSATEQDLLRPTRKSYAGPLELGEDLMVIDIGSIVTVRPAPPSR